MPIADLPLLQMFAAFFGSLAIFTAYLAWPEIEEVARRYIR